MNKKLIITISTLLVAVILVTLICAVFIVGDIIVRPTSELLMSDEDKAKVISDSKIVKNSSIFALSEDIAISNIEKENPLLKVIQIERKIPNKIVLNVTSRVGIIAVADVEGGYWIIDRELKVIDRKDDLKDDFCAVTTGVTLPADVSVGTFLKDLNWLERVISGLEGASFIGKRFGSFIVNIDKIELDSGKIMINLTTNTGVKLIVPYAKDAITEEIIKNEYLFYLTRNDEDRTHGEIRRTNNGFEYFD